MMQVSGKTLEPIAIPRILRREGGTTTLFIQPV